MKEPYSPRKALQIQAVPMKPLPIKLVDLTQASVLEEEETRKVEYDHDLKIAENFNAASESNRIDTANLKPP
jgi:hypothetical protein